MTILSDVVYTAKQKHRCCECGRAIHPSETYRRQTYVDGEFYTYKAHTECHTASLEYDALCNWSGYYEEVYNLIDVFDPEDGEWLKESFPIVAKRMGVK